MSEQVYTTDTAVERLTREVAAAVESAGRFTRAEFSVDDVATVLEAAVQQPTRAQIIAALDGKLVATAGGHSYRTLTLGERETFADAVLAALPIPATGEAPVWVKSDGTRHSHPMPGTGHWEFPEARKPAAAPSDTDRIVRRLRRMSRMRNLLRPGLAEPESYQRTLTDAADALSRTSQPVQVEVTDDMVEKAAKALFREYYGAGWDDAQGSADVEVCTSNARAALSAALGGGE